MPNYRQDDACNISASETLEEAKESDDVEIFEPEDPSRLTVWERQTLLECGVRPEDFGFDSCRSPPHEEPERPSDEMTVERAEALAEQFGCDGSQLTPEQKRVIYKLCLACHLTHQGLRSPQHYPYFEEQSNPASAPEEVWPGAMAYIKACSLKRSYLDPEDLIERLCKLKPSDNFELRKPRRPIIEWERSPLLEKKATISIPRPNWIYYLGEGNRIRRASPLAELIAEGRRGRWRKVVGRDIDQAPTPDLHLLKDMGHSPGGTLFPRYLVKGLGALRERADLTGDEYYDEEYEVAESQKAEATDRWKERHPDSILKEDRVSHYRTWPADLTDELDEIDRESIRRGRKRYINLLQETEKKMQELVAFWRDCGAITGQKTPPLSWWLSSWWISRSSKEPLLWPSRLEERLDAIMAESPGGGYSKLIEICRWKEAIVNTGSEPAPLDTPFPQSLLDELVVVCKAPWSTFEEMEDDVFEAISRWREAKDKKPAEPQISLEAGLEEVAQEARSSRSSEQGPASQPYTSDSAIVLEELTQLCKDQPRGTGRPSRTNSTITDQRTTWRDRLRPRTRSTIAKEQTSWRDRLRPRPGIIDASRNTTKAALTRPGKPRGITKQYSRKTSRKPREPAKGHAVIPVTPKADALDLSSIIGQQEVNGSTIIIIYA
ncbi:MAG: hypothetical protein Q9211_003552 [Gyalolechia sp. 1 TL-2023]